MKEEQRELADLEQAIVTVLEAVYDPCSLASGTPLSLIDMGLFEGWRLDQDNHLHVTLCVTSGTCMMAPVFVKAAEDRLAEIDGIESAHVTVDTAVFWTEDRLSHNGRTAIEKRRAAIHAALRAENRAHPVRHEIRGRHD